MSEQQETQSTNTRHTIETIFYIKTLKETRDQFGFKRYVPQEYTWSGETTGALSTFVLNSLPDWKHLTLIKHKNITDNGKKSGSKIMSTKDKFLKISRYDIDDVDHCLCVKTDRDLTVNGKVPKIICEFMKIKEGPCERQG